MYTNKTPNLKLPQYLSTDVPSIMEDFNEAMRLIDAAVGSGGGGGSTDGAVFKFKYAYLDILLNNGFTPVNGENFKNADGSVAETIEPGLYMILLDAIDLSGGVINMPNTSFDILFSIGSGFSFTEQFTASNVGVGKNVCWAQIANPVNLSELKQRYAWSINGGEESYPETKITMLMFKITF